MTVCHAALPALKSKPTVALHQFSARVLGVYTRKVKSKTLFVLQHSAGFQCREINLKQEISHCLVSALKDAQPGRSLANKERGNGRGGDTVFK